MATIKVKGGWNDQSTTLRLLDKIISVILPGLNHEGNNSWPHEERGLKKKEPTSNSTRPFFNFYFHTLL